MLQTIDQWAFSVLVVLYNLLGVADIPRDQSADWKVIERWTEQSDKSYRLVIESSTYPQKCEKSPDNYVEFPQVYFGRQQILVDGIQIYSNETTKWKLGSGFDKPSVSCQTLKQGKVITFSTDSYMRFFASVHSYPILTTPPKDRFFYSGIYLAAIAIILSLGITGTILLIKFKSNEHIINFIAQDFLFSMVMFCFYSSHFLSVDVTLLHYMSILGLWGGCIYYMGSYYLSDRRVNQVFLGFLFVVTISYGHRNLMQCLVVFPWVFFSIAQIGVCYKVFTKKGYSLSEKLINLSLPIIGTNEMYISHVIRDGRFHLSVFLVIVSWAKFLKVIKEVNEKEIQLHETNQKLKDERLMVDRISSIYEGYQQVVHDLKSPLTSINFLLAAKTQNQELISKLRSQLSELIYRIDSGIIRIAPDWYSSELLMASLDDIVQLKCSQLEETQEIHLRNLSTSSFEAFFDPLDLKVILTELIDNSIKNAKQSVEIQISVLGGESQLKILIEDNGVGVAESDIKKLGTKGFTVGGTGRGLHGILVKLKSWSGDAIFENSQARIGFSVTLLIRSRLSK